MPVSRYIVCKLIHREHLGLLDVQQKEGMEPAPLDVEDPACDEFYLNTWMKTAQNNTQLFEKVRNLWSRI